MVWLKPIERLFGFRLKLELPDELPGKKRAYFESTLAEMAAGEIYRQRNAEIDKDFPGAKGDRLERC
jgi:hypothetical protein